MGERDARSLGSAYGRLYGPIAVAAVLIAPQPLIEPHRSGTIAAFVQATSVGEDDWSWWDSVRDLLFGSFTWPTEELGVAGMLLLVGLVGGLVYATIRPARRPRLPLGLALLSAALVLVLLVKPGAGGSAPGVSYIRTPAPDLTGAGRAALVLALFAAAVAVAHLLQLHRLSRKVAPR